METGDIIGLISLVLLIGVVLTALFLKQRENDKLKTKIKAMEMDHERDLEVLTGYPGRFKVEIWEDGWRCGYKVVKIITTLTEERKITIKSFFDFDLEFCKREAEELCEILNQR